MLITKYSDQYIKIASPYIDAVIADPDSYTGIEITGSINCCTDYKNVLLTADTSWFLNLNRGVVSELTLNALRFQNIITGEIFTYDTTIYLGYVNDTCSGNLCTLQTYSAHFVTIKDAIDAFFATKSISSDVTVAFNGNVVSISNLPANYLPYSAIQGTEEVKSTFSTPTTNLYFLETGGLYIKPEFFNLTAFVDGVYKFTLKIIKLDNSFTLETSCAFIDIKFKCKVAANLKTIIEESQDVKDVEKRSMTIHVLHYALVNGSNCGCNCGEMCDIFKELSALLDTTDPQILNDCGC